MKKNSKISITLKIQTIYKNSISKNYILFLAKEYNLDKEIFTNYNNTIPFNNFINLKKRNKISLTVISGPHVHKKSREQFNIPLYTYFYTINLSSNLKNFSLFKQTLLNKFNENALVGSEISFAYTINEKILL